MQSEVSEISPVLVEVKVEVPWEKVQKELDSGFATVARTAKVRGFRPGKVPRNVVRQLFGRQVKGEVTASLIEQGLVQAMRDGELQIVSQPEVVPSEIEDGQALSFTAKMEVRPKVEDVDTSRLVVYRDAAEVTDADVDAEVDRMREQQAELRVPEPMRGAKAADQLTIDYTVTIDGEAKDDMAATDRPVELGQDRLIPEFEARARRHVSGESKDIDVTFADDHGREDLRGKTACFHIEVKELREKLLPEMDDELAKDLGDYETLLELRLDIRKRLETTAIERAEASLKDQLVDRLVEANAVPVPPSMVHQQEQQMMYEFAAFMQMTGQGLPMSEDLHERMHARAERRVRAGILLGALARKEGVSITPEEVADKLAQIAEQTGKHIAKVRVEYQGEEREQLESQLLEEKLMGLLRNRAIVREGPPPPEGGGDAEETMVEGKRAKAKKAAAAEPEAEAKKAKPKGKSKPPAGSDGEAEAAPKETAKKAAGASKTAGKAAGAGAKTAKKAESGRKTAKKSEGQ